MPTFEFIMRSFEEISFELGRESSMRRLKGRSSEGQPSLEMRFTMDKLVEGSSTLNYEGIGFSSLNGISHHSHVVD